jgi:hypothetical protein
VCTPISIDLPLPCTEAEPKDDELVQNPDYNITIAGRELFQTELVGPVHEV